MKLDIRTMVFLLALGCLMLGIAQLLTRRAEQRGMGIGTWASANFAQCAAWALLALRDLIPDFASVSLGNGLLIASFALQRQALLQLQQRPTHEAQVWLPSLALAVLLLFIEQAPGRIIAASTLIALLCFANAHLLLGAHPSKVRRGEQLVGGFYLMLALAQSLRVAHSALANDKPEHLFANNAIQGLTFITLYAAVVFLSFGFVLLVNQRLARDLERLATLDSLTEVYNRRMWSVLAEKELTRSRRRTAPASVLMFDLDRFKTINDRFGHLAGDKVIQCFSQRIRDNLRSFDLFGRYGGEEFCLFLPDTGLDEGLLLAERLRQLIAAAPCQIDEHHTLPFTVSVGISCAQPGGVASLEQLLDQADQALYHAKSNGRNRVARYIATPSSSHGSYLGYEV